ncbi:hypothetical protein M413DRAFT_411724 [Hebeloma cylindrosporum]|uniref:PEBP-like protein n=1 Tax=Hebeloma cylindrosporum TaxID=76867 RepID=A0A0C3BW74_HEBCY|nr:hypothetical protein M413DRAFT_411724 [Hebeloma cylindrosporum h7]
MLISACIILLLGLAIAQDTSLLTVKSSFDDANIPETIHLIFDPRILLDVTFFEPSGESITLHADNDSPSATAGPPSFGVVENIGRPGPFVIAAIDPDVPTPQNPTVSQVRHFLGGNFVFANTTASKHGGRLVNTTPAVTEFQQPRPRAGSDPHRYIFLLFEQSKNFNDQTWITPTTPVTFFNLSTFAAAVGLGQPIGGTFMFVGPDPTTKAQS